MKRLPQRLIAALLIGLAGSGGWAYTVGRAQGLPLIGRSLDVSVPVQTQGVGDAAPECAVAEVFYGDIRVSPERTSVEVQSTAGGASYRVRSAVSINEPVVTVYLHLGCGNRFTRRFVLLAEQPGPETEPERPARVVPQASVAAVPASPGSAPARRTAAGPSTSAGSAASSTDGTKAPAVAAQAPAEPRPSAAPRPRANAATRAPAPAARPRPEERLRLEPADLEAFLPPLRSSSALAIPEDPSRRSAAAALWAAINASPEDVMRRSERVEALEREVAGLRQASSRSEKAATELQGQLQRARAERYANPVVYGLALAALLLLIAAVVFWRRSRAGGRGEWWRTDLADSELFDKSPAARQSIPATAPSPPPEVDLDLGPGVFAGEPAQDDAALRTDPNFRAPDDFEAAGPPSLRSLRAVELHDVQQEADFFLSLGEHDRAVEVLRSHIRSQPETSALAWLDLLDIHHRLGQREAFDQVRAELNRTFNTRVPAFDGYHEDEGPGLEGYANALTRIMALWPTRRVLDVIEESIFRPPGRDGAPAFSLQAYRDLLMLHHIATELLDREEPSAEWHPSSIGSGFSSTNIQPLSAAEIDQHLAPPSMDIDFDLSEPVAQPRLVDPPAQPANDGHLLDFDLPDIDTSQYRAKKTRE